jgi:hypothetical protein
MSSKEKIKQKSEKLKEFSITPVDELPKADRLKPSFYDTILDEVIKDKTRKFFRIEIPNKTFKAIYAPLNVRIEKHGYQMRIRVAKQKLYIEKLTQEEHNKYLKDLEDRRQERERKKKTG